MIKQLNDNYVNVWIVKTDLENLEKKNGADNLPPLKKLIVNNFSPRSPVDTFIITPELKLMGVLRCNNLLQAVFSGKFHGDPAFGYKEFLKQPAKKLKGS